MKLILASKSATRLQILRAAGLSPETIPAAIDERALEAVLSDASPPQVAIHLAQAKAEFVSDKNRDAVVIGADQTLAMMGECFHKPIDRADARRQLMQLRGQTHQLHSGLAIAINGRVTFTVVTTANLTMRSFSAAALDECLGKMAGKETTSVGGYQIEGPAIQLFEVIDGDWFTILGLPLLPLLGALRDLGVLPQ